MSIRAKTKRRVTILVVVAVLVVGELSGYVIVKKAKWSAMVAAARVAGLEAAKKGDYPTAVDRLTLYLGLHWDDLEALRAYAEVRPKVEPRDPMTAQRTMHALRRILELDESSDKERYQLLELYARYGFVTETVDAANALLSRHKLIVDKTDPRWRQKIDVTRYTTEDIKALQYKTMALTRLTRYKEGLETADEWCVVDSKNLRAHMSALALMEDLKMGKVPVLERAETFRKLRPAAPESDLLEGYAYALVQDYDNARKLMRAAGADGREIPDNDFGLLLVMQLNDLGLYDDSLKILTRLAATKGNENNLEIIKALARRKWESNRPQEVIELTNRLDIKNPETDSEMLMMRASALRQTGKGEAADAIVEALAARPNDIVADAWVQVLTQFNGKQGADKNLRKTMDTCERALKRDSRSTYLRYFLGETYAQLGENELAINEWQRVQQENQTWYLPLVRLSNLRLAGKNYEVAMLASDEARRRAPMNPVAIINQANVWSASLDSGKAEKAENLLEMVNKVQQLLPGEEQTLVIQVTLLCKLGQPQKAAEVIRKLLGGSELSEATLLQLAQVSHNTNLGLEDECFARSEKGHGLSPSLAYGRAVAMHLKGSTADGLAFLRAAAEKSPNKGDVAWKLLTARYMDMTSDPKAKEEWIALGDSMPENLMVQESAIEARSLRDEREFMDRAIERVKALSPGEGTRWRLARARWLAWPKASNADLEQAAILLSQVVEKAPGTIEARYLLAQCLERLGKVDAAIAQLTQTVQLDPTNESVALYLAKLLTDHAEFDKAREQLERAAKMTQNNPEARRATAAMFVAIGDSARAMELMKGANAGDEKSDLMRAMLYRQRNELDKADALVHKMLEKPDPVTVQFAADLFASEGKKDEAEKTLGLLDKLELKPGIKELLQADYASRHIGQDEAIKLFKAATAAAPTNAMTWRSLIVYCLAVGRSNDAAAALDEARKAAPNDKSLEALANEKDMLTKAAADPQLHALAVAFAQRPSDQAAAGKAIRVVLNAHVDNKTPEQIAGELRPLADASLQLRELQDLTTRMYVMSGRFDPAITIATRAVKNFPTSPEVARTAVQVLCTAGRWQEALGAAKEWRERIVANPLPADMAISLAYIKSSQPRSAAQQLETYIDKAMVTPEQSVDVLMQYAAALNAAGDSKKAADLLFPLTQKSAIWRRSWLQLTMLPEPEMPRDQAPVWLERLKPVIAPDSVDELTMLGEAWNALGEKTPIDTAENRAKKEQYYQKAEDVLGPLSARPDATVPSLVAMGVRMEQRGKLKEAEELYRRALKANGNQIVAQNNLAMILVKGGGSLDEAMGLASSAVKAQPTRATLYDTLATVQEKKQLYDAATESMQQALRLEPASIEWRVHLCEILLACGRRQEAQRVDIDIQALPDSRGPMADELKDRLQKMRSELEKRASK